MNKVFIEGRLGRDAEVKEASNGNKFVRFTMAVNWRRANGKDKEDKTTWYDVSSFNPAYTGKLVEYLTSGTAVIVVGDLEPEMNEGKDGKMYLNMIVRANSIEFPRTGKKEDNSSSSSTSTTAKPQAKAKKSEDIPDDEIACVSSQPSTSEASVSNAVDESDDLPF